VVQSKPVTLRKLQPQRIFNGSELLAPDQVLVVNSLGKVIDIIPATEAGEGVERIDGWMIPGLINCHCHLELSHLAGVIPEKTGLPGFVQQILSCRDFPEADRLLAMECADRLMWQGGIQAVGDISNRIDSLQVKTNSSITYHNFIEVSGWMPSVAEKRYRSAKQVLDTFLESTSRASLVPHAPYSVSAELWKLLEPHFYGRPITLHNQESKAEQSLFEKGKGEWPEFYSALQIGNEHFLPSGKSSLQSIFSYLQCAAPLLLVHNTFTTEADIEQVESQHDAVFWCLCPQANRYIEDAFPPAELFRKKNSKLVVGTDSLASNHSLSILDEMKLLAQHFPALPAEEMLRWATSQGAAALQLEDQLGYLRPGTSPGILQLEGLSSEESIGPQSRITRWW
jgi:cytosine/adenosine deaminase-related metal-dependent hydrolase